jgi:hypothetical protein
MPELNKGERSRIWSMIEEVSAQDTGDSAAPNKLEAYLADGSSIKVYKVPPRITRIDIEASK